MAEYPIPHWIPGAPDTASQFLGGLRAGAAIQQEQARLAQEANLTNMQMALRAQEAQRNNQLESQRLAQEQAYHNQQMDIQRQELQQAQQLNQIKIQDAARTYQAQQQYQQWLQSNPDADPAEGILKFFPGTDSGAMTGYGSLAHNVWLNRRKIEPPSVENIDVNGRQVPFMRIPKIEGGYDMKPIRGEGTDVEGRMIRMHTYDELNRRRDRIEAEAAKDTMGEGLLADAPADPAAEKAYRDKLPLARRAMYDVAKKRQQRLDEIDQSLSGMLSRGFGDDDGSTAPRLAPPRTAPPAAAAAPAPTPAGGVKVIKIRPAGAAAAPSPAVISASNAPAPGFAGGPIAPPYASPPPDAAPGPSGPGPGFLARPPEQVTVGPPETLPGTPATAPLRGQVEPIDPARNQLALALDKLSDYDLAQAAKRLRLQARYDPDKKRFQVGGDSFDREDFIGFIASTAARRNVSPLQ